MTLSAGAIAIDWDIVLKAVPVAVAVATTIYKFRDLKPRRRASLKADLELLQMARNQNLTCNELAGHIETELGHVVIAS